MCVRVPKRASVVRRLATGLAMAAAIPPVAAIPAHAAPVAAPERVVSMNLCTDELVLQLLPPDRVASVTYLAVDPGLSTLADRAADIPVNHGVAEEILAFDPDLVVAGEYTTRQTTAFLERIGEEVVVVPLARSLDAVHEIVLDLARRLGATDRARAMLARMEAGLEPVVVADDRDRPRALVLNPNGFTVGAGSLVSELIEGAGMENAARTLRIDNYGQLPLEVAITADVDVLIIDAERDGAPSLATALLQHPALKALGRRVVSLSLPSRLWTCPGPQLLRARALLEDAARRARRVAKEK